MATKQQQLGVMIRCLLLHENDNGNSHLEGVAVVLQEQEQEG